MSGKISVIAVIHAERLIFIILQSRFDKQNLRSK